MKLPIVPHMIRNDPVTSFRFIVFFQGHSMAFQSISGIGKSIDVQYFNEGGVNGYPIIMRGPQSSPHKLVFRRGLIVRRLSTTLLGFVPDLASSILDSENAIRNPDSLGIIFVLDTDRELKAIYSFISQGYVDWQVSDLNAMSNEVIIETFTISHQGLKNIPVPADLTKLFNKDFFNDLSSNFSSGTSSSNNESNNDTKKKEEDKNNLKDENTKLEDDSPNQENKDDEPIDEAPNFGEQEEKPKEGNQSTSGREM